MSTFRAANSKWSLVNCTGDIPAGRIGHTLVTNDEEDTVFLYGGVNDTNEHASQYLEDLYSFNYKTKHWTKIEMTGDVQCPRAFHTAVFHGGKMYVFGGCNGRGRFNKLFSIAPDGVCAVIPTAQTQPSTRYCHSAVMFDHRMYVFAGKCGGRNSNKRLSDLFVFDFQSELWSECEQIGATPPPRSAHAAFTCGRSMVMFGGRNSSGECCEDLYRFQYDTGIWTKIETRHGSLFGRARHSVVMHNGKVVVFGGWNGKKKLNDLFYYNMDSESFEIAADQDESCPSRRECHVAVTCNNTMVVFGGRFRGTFMSDTCELELGAKSLKDQCRDWVLQYGVPFTQHSLPHRVSEYVAKWKALNEVQTRPPVIGVVRQTPSASSFLALPPMPPPPPPPPPPAPPVN